MIVKFVWQVVLIGGFPRELEKAVEPHVKQEDEGKFRCKACNKLFKATSFVQKHVSGKHPDLVQQLDDVRSFLVLRCVAVLIVLADLLF